MKTKTSIASREGIQKCVDAAALPSADPKLTTESFGQIMFWRYFEFAVFFINVGSMLLYLI